jgi:hypothetical protein
VGLNPADHIERACLCVKNVTSRDKAGWGSPTAPSFFFSLAPRNGVSRCPGTSVSKSDS